MWKYRYKSHLAMFGQLNAGASDLAGHVAIMGVTGKAYKMFVG